MVRQGPSTARALAFFFDWAFIGIPTDWDEGGGTAPKGEAAALTQSIFIT